MNLLFLVSKFLPMLSRLTDKLVLTPKRFPIPVNGRSRRLIEFEGGSLEVWAHQVQRGQYHRAALDDVQIFVLKLVGAGGRAECVSHHPLDSWRDVSGEIWALNPPGFGCSSGHASLRTWASAPLAVFQELARVANGRPIVISANSLGTAAALSIAANHEVAGLILRNPPPLRELIIGKYGWWNLTLGARLIAAQIPQELNSIQLAAQCKIPCVFVSSAKDRVVPVSYQVKVIENYVGPSQTLVLPEAGHGTPMTKQEVKQYSRQLDWLRQHIRPMGSSSVSC